MVTQSNFIFVIVVMLAPITLLYLIPSLAVMWQLFKKAGRQGWLAIIPVYGSVVMAQIAGQKTWLGWTVGVSSALYSLTSLVPEVDDLKPLSATIFLVTFIFGLYLLRAFIVSYTAGIGRWLLYIFVPIIGVFFVKDVNYKNYQTQNVPLAPQQPQPMPTAQPPASQDPNSQSPSTY